MKDTAVLHQAAFWALFCYSELLEFFYKSSQVSLIDDLFWKTAQHQEKIQNQEHTIQKKQE